ncbi:MAG: DUF2142 domain-containing protein [Methanobrevibacter sp.]|nr:DUF2142 domain-containing protein [Methanobrevibacter sp.]
MFSRGFLNKDNILNTKKYWITFLFIILIGTLFLTKMENIHAPFKEIIFFILMALIGVIFLIITIEKNIELYKTAFCLLLIMGILFSVFTPVDSIPDEKEHFVRSEFMSGGVLVPESNNGSYISIASVNDLYDANSFKTIETNTAGPINYSHVPENGAALQNPFYGYLPQGIGIFLAKLLSLDAFFMLILGRLFNSISYAGLVSLAIKKTPILKIPLFAMACLPLCLFQSFSVSIDSMINGLAIFLIAYFLYMYKNKNLDKREIAIYSLTCLLLGLCKLPYLALILLLLLIPKNNFSNEKNYYFVFITPLILGIIGFSWYNLFASSAYLDSWRGFYMANSGVNATLQIKYASTHLAEFFSTMTSSDYIYDLLIGLSSFSYNEHVYINNSIAMLLVMFIGGVCLFYPLDEKFSRKTRFGLLIISLIIFFAIYLIQFLTWTPVGNQLIIGVQSRYFLPLLPLAPIIFNLNREKSDVNLDNFVLTFSMCFISLAFLLMIFNFY